MSEPFLSRWSRRKRSAPEQVEAEDERLAREQALAAPAAQVDASAEAEPPVELPAIESLTPEADFTPFMQPKVPPHLKNAALKKLFTDPHFNVMDGLDTYIDDYTKSEPIPEAMLRSLVQSRALRLFEHEEKDEEKDEIKAGQGAQQDAPFAPRPTEAPLMASLPDEIEPVAVASEPGTLLAPPSANETDQVAAPSRDTMPR